MSRERGAAEEGRKGAIGPRGEKCSGEGGRADPFDRRVLLCSFLCSSTGGLLRRGLIMRFWPQQWGNGREVLSSSGTSRFSCSPTAQRRSGTQARIRSCRPGVWRPTGRLSNTNHEMSTRRFVALYSSDRWRLLFCLLACFDLGRLDNCLFGADWQVEETGRSKGPADRRDRQIEETGRSLDREGMLAIRSSVLDCLEQVGVVNCVVDLNSQMWSKWCVRLPRVSSSGV